MASRQSDTHPRSSLWWWVAWTMAAVAIPMTVWAIGLGMSGGTSGPVGGLASARYLVALVVVGVGALVASRRPRNPIGWILLVGGLLFVLANVSNGYLNHHLSPYIDAHLEALGFDPDPDQWEDWMQEAYEAAWDEGWAAAAAEVPILPWAEWAGSVLNGFFLPSLALLLLLFPEGRLPSSRWRWTLWLLLASMMLGLVGLLVSPVSIAGDGAIVVPSPTGVDLSSSTVATIDRVIGAGLGVVILASLAAVVVRYRRSSGIERQQYRWVTFPLIGAIIGLVLELLGLLVMSVVVGDGTDADLSSPVWRVGVILFWIGIVLLFIGLAALPLAMAVAVLRFRLYDLGRVVNRTVTYFLVAGSLAVVYFTTVAALTTVLPQQNQLTVAASTLAVAAMFNPVRKRVQGWVDRRFNRARYDGQREIDELAGRLREAHDIEEISDDMLDVVTKTMQPSAVAVWVREPV